MMTDHINLPMKLRLGTRGSQLARWQTDYVAALLQTAWPRMQIATLVITTKGDRTLDTPLPLIGGKGLFTLELEESLRCEEIDIAVHSLKDLPTESPAGLTLGAIPARANPADVLISRAAHTLASLPHGATVGTSSKRRAAQLLAHRPDLHIIDIRGNVDTRIRKVQDADGPYDATVLAYAGVARLERLDVVSEILPFDLMLPAPGQGALGVQCRDHATARTLLAPICDAETTAAVTAERAFLAALGGGCATPVAALATVEDGVLRLQGRVTAPDGTQQVDVVVHGSVHCPARVGLDAARQALAQGASGLIGEL